MKRAKLFGAFLTIILIISVVGGSHLAYGAPGVVEATIDIRPDTLNLNSQGKWITAYIELPEGYQVEDIDCSKVILRGMAMYTVTQGDSIQAVRPIRRTRSANAFYNYYSASGHTPYMEDRIGKIYLYQDATTGVLSLIMHQGIDNGESDVMRADFDFSGIPEGAYVTLSDDIAHPPDPRKEFDIALKPEGHWWHRENSDGGVLGGLPRYGEWSMTITPSNWENIDAWRYVRNDGSEFDLDMGEPVTISHKQPPIFASSCDMPLESVIGDYDVDGVLDYMVKFDRSDVQDLIRFLGYNLPTKLTLMVAGTLPDGTVFWGVDTIMVIDKGGKK